MHDECLFTTLNVKVIIEAEHEVLIPEQSLAALRKHNFEVAAEILFSCDLRLIGPMLRGVSGAPLTQMYGLLAYHISRIVVGAERQRQLFHELFPGFIAQEIVLHDILAELVFAAHDLSIVALIFLREVKQANGPLRITVEHFDEVAVFAALGVRQYLDVFIDHFKLRLTQLYEARIVLLA